jgi:hypothetical protein
MHALSRTPYPLKVRRLEQLDELGLNVADFICFPPKQLKVSELKDFCAAHESVSCRTFAAEEDKDFKTPVKYEINNFEEVIAFAKQHNEKYFVLVNEAIPLKDSLFAGNLMFNSPEDFLCEYFRGEGTPRDLENRRVFRAIRRDDIAQPWLGQLLELVNRFPFRPAIFEFSVYPYAIGRRQNRIIFWEWRKF